MPFNYSPLTHFNLIHTAQAMKDETMSLEDCTNW